MKTIKVVAIGAISGLTALMDLRAASLTWDATTGTSGAQDGSGTWNITSTNWWNGAANTNWNNAMPDSATFGAGGSAGTVSLGVPVSVGGLTFAGVAGGNYLIQSNTITLVGTPTISASANATINSILTGASFIKTNTGTLTLGGANTFTGVTQVSDGIVQANVSGALGGGMLSITNAAVRLQIANGVTLTNPIVIGPNAGASGNGLVQVNATSTGTITGPITINNNAAAGGHFGSAALATALLRVNGAITSSVPVVSRVGYVIYSGGGSYSYFNIAQDTAGIGTNDGLATAAAVNVGGSAAGTFDLRGFNQTIAGLTNSFSGTIQNSGATLSTLTLNNSSTLIYTGFINGAVALMKTGTGTQILQNGNSAFTGTVTVAGGELRVTSTGSGTNSALGLRNGNRTITVQTNATLNLTINNVFGGTGQTTSGVQSIVINGGTVAATRYNALGNLTLNGGTLTQSSTDGGNNEGYLFLGSVTVGGSTPSTIATGNGTGNHLLGGGSTVFNVADATLDANADLIVSAPLRNGSADYGGVGGFTKIGAGTMRLDANNSFTGVATVNAGTLALNAGGSLSNATILTGTGGVFDVSAFGNYTIPPQTTILGSGTIIGSLAATDASRVSPGNLGSAGTLTIASDFLQTANYTNYFDVTNSVTVGGGVNDLLVINGAFIPFGASIAINALSPLSSGTYRLINCGAMLDTNFNPVIVGATSRDTWSLDLSVATQVSFVVSSGTNLALRWSANNSAEWDLGSTNWTVIADGTTDRYFDADSVLFDDSTASNVVALNTLVRPASITINSSSNYVFTGTGGIAGGFGFLAPITKTGSGTLTMGTVNSFGGGIVMNGGALIAATNNAFGTGVVTLAGADLVQTGGSFSIRNVIRLDKPASIDTGVGNLTVNGYLTGSGSVTKIGSGTLALTGAPPASVWTGNIVVAQGSLANNSPANAFPFGYTGTNRSMFVASGATVSNANWACNPLGIEGQGLMKLIVSNGTYWVGSSNQIRELDMYGGQISPNGGQTDGLDLRTNAIITVFTNPTAAAIDSYVKFRNTAIVNVQDGPSATDMVFGHGVAGGNIPFYLVKRGAGTLVFTGAVDNGGTLFRHEEGITIMAKTNSAAAHCVGSTSLVVVAGTVQLAGSGDDQIYTIVDVDLLGGFLDMNGRNEGFDELRGTGTVINTASATLSTLTLDQNNGTCTFGGAINDGAGAIKVMKVGTGAITLSGTNVYSGPTIVSNGAIYVDGATIGSAFSAGSNATVGGNGTIGGNVVVSNYAQITANRIGLPGTLNISSNLTLFTNSIPVVFDLTNGATIGGGANDLIAVGGNLDPNGASIQINQIAPLGAGSYRLFNYGGSKTSVFNSVVIATNLTRLGWALDEATSGQVNLVVNGSFLGLKWKPQTSTNWDNNVGTNWLDLAGATNTVFRDGDSVTFDDSGATTNNIGIVGIVRPNAFTVDSSSNYSIVGAGKISGIASLTKSGNGTLTLGGTANDFIGAVVVSAGVIKASSAGFLGKAANVAILPAGQVNLNGVAQTGTNYYYTISGSGPDGRGAIVNTNGGLVGNSSVKWLELTNNATIGALGTLGQANENGRLDVALAGGINGNGYTLTKVGFAPMDLRGSATNLQFIIAEGMVYREDGTEPFGTNVIVNAGAIIGAYGSRTTAVPVTLNGGTLASRQGGGACTWSGPITLAADSYVVTAPGYGYANEDVFVSGSISGPGKLIKRGQSALRLFNTNNYTGGTLIENSTNGVLILASTNGPAIGGAIQIGHTNTGGGFAYLYTSNNNQFAAGATLSFRGSPSDWAWLKLFGTTQYVAAINSDDYEGGIIDHVNAETNFNSDSALVITGPGDSYWSGGFMRDTGTNIVSGKLKIVQAGNGTLSLAGGKSNALFSGGVAVNSGVLNVKSAYAAGRGAITMNGGTLALDGSGLKEDLMGTTNVNMTASNGISTAVVLWPARASLPADGPAYLQYSYSGYIINTSSVPVTWTFAEQFDDNAYLKIDSTIVFNDNSWNNPTLGTITLAPGLHTFDLRLQNNGGGGGPTTNFWWQDNAYSVGVDFQGLGISNKVYFQRLEDNGSGSLLVTDVQIPNNISLNADSTVRVSGVWGPTNSIQGPISGAGGITKTGAGTLSLTGTNSYGGATTVANGKLFVDGTHFGAGAYTVNSNTLLWGTGIISVASASIQGGAQLGPENTNVLGTLTVGSLTLNAGAKVTALLRGTNPTHRSLGNLSSSSGVLLYTLPLGPAATGTNVLIDYGTNFVGAISDFVVSIPNGGQGDLVNNTLNTSIDLIITNAGAGIKWDGTIDSSWRNAGLPNWKSILSGSATAFSPLDSVLFDDTASGTTTVTLGDGVGPGSLVVSNETKNYTFAGSGSIGGSISLAKYGAAKLTITAANSFTGMTTVAGGTLAVFNDACLGAVPPAINPGQLRLFSGTTFEITGNTTLPANRGVRIGPSSGSGTVTISVPTNVVATGSALLQNATGAIGGLTKAGSGTLVLNPASPNNYSGGTVVDNGVLVLSYSQTNLNLGSIAGPLTINSGAVVRTTAATALGFANSASGNVSVVTINGGLLDHAGSNGIGGGQTVYMTGGEIRSNGGTPSTNSGCFRFHGAGTDPTMYILASSSTSLISGRVALDATGKFDVQDGAADMDLLINAIVTDGLSGGTGVGIAKSNSGTMALTSANVYSGTTKIDGGRLLANNGAGSATGTGEVLVVTGGTLGGTGTVAGMVTQNGGSVAPGVTIGKLTILSGYTQIDGSLDIQIAGTNSATQYDVLDVGNQALLIGTLNVTLTNYAPVAGDSFAILTTSNGVFGTFNAPMLPPLSAPGLGWQISYMPTSAPTMVILSVTSAPTGYDAWAAQIAGTNTAYNQSALGDGYPNLLKYATGSSPTNSDNLASMSAARLDGVLQLLFNHDTNATDIRLIVEGAYTSTNDATWNGIATNIAGSWGSATNVVENTATNPASVTVSDTAGPSTNRFLRLRVTRP